MKKIFQNLLFHFSKWIGLFAISRYITRKGLRILCYHSFDMGDNESNWRPSLIIRPKTFHRRLDYLSKENFTIIELEQAVDLMIKNKLPNYSAVITIDDGWYSIKAVAHKMLKEKSYPYTIYHTSYYSSRETPIYNLIVPYIFWKTQKDILNLDELNTSMTGIYRLDNPSESQGAIQKIVEYGDKNLNNTERCALTRRLGECLEVDYAKIENSRILNLLTSSEVMELAAQGVNFQLHSHRHRWPMQKHEAFRELKENQEFLEPLTGKETRHFCYPSGNWSHEQIPYLLEAGVKSATTTMGGINYHGNAQQFILRRITDGENKSQIRFEAEVSGFFYLLKKIQRLLTMREGSMGTNNEGP